MSERPERVNCGMIVAGEHSPDMMWDDAKAFWNWFDAPTEYVRHDIHTAAIEQAKREERATITAWMRRQSDESAMLRWAADCIENGEHLEGRT